MNSEKYIYVFIRTDLPAALQAVHACHAVHHATRSWAMTEIGIPNLILIGVRSEHSLLKARKLLADNHLGFFAWADPDDDSGQYLTLATAPLDDWQRKILAHYRLYSPGAPTGARLLIENGRAKADVAQLREHSVSNGEVGSENLPVGSKTSHAAPAVQP